MVGRAGETTSRNLWRERKEKQSTKWIVFMIKYTKSSIPECEGMQEKQHYVTYIERKRKGKAVNKMDLFFM